MKLTAQSVGVLILLLIMSLVFQMMGVLILPILNLAIL